MTYGFTERWPIVAKWGSERWDVWEGERVVGTIWDWRPGVAGDVRWSAEALSRTQTRVALARGVRWTKPEEALDWLREYWVARRSGVFVPAPALR